MFNVKLNIFLEKTCPYHTNVQYFKRSFFFTTFLKFQIPLIEYLFTLLSPLL